MYVIYLGPKKLDNKMRLDIFKLCLCWLRGTVTLYLNPKVKAFISIKCEMIIP